MAKKKKARAKAGRPALFTPPPADFGRTVEVGIKSAREGETVLVLTDGTKVHARVLPTSIARSLNKFNANGDPIYVIQAGLVLRTDVPKKLKRKIKS